MTPKERKATQESLTVPEEDYPLIRYLVDLGFHHKRIAALYDVNQGRISEIDRTRNGPPEEEHPGEALAEWERSQSRKDEIRRDLDRIRS